MHQKMCKKCLKMRFKGVEKCKKTHQVPEGYFRPGPRGNTNFQVPSVVSKSKHEKNKHEKMAHDKSAIPVSLGVREAPYPQLRC